jgi:hypothetical protein
MVCIWWLAWLASEAALIAWQVKKATVESRFSGSPTPYLTALVAIATSTILTLLTGVALGYFLTEPLSYLLGAGIFAAWGWHCWQQFVAAWRMDKLMDLATQAELAQQAQESARGDG